MDPTPLCGNVVDCGKVFSFYRICHAAELLEKSVCPKMTIFRPCSGGRKREQNMLKVTRPPHRWNVIPEAIPKVPPPKQIPEYSRHIPNNGNFYLKFEPGVLVCFFSPIGFLSHTLRFTFPTKPPVKSHTHAIEVNAPLETKCHKI